MKANEITNKVIDKVDKMKMDIANLDFTSEAKSLVEFVNQPNFDSQRKRFFDTEL